MRVRPVLHRLIASFDKGAAGLRSFCGAAAFCVGAILAGDARAVTLLLDTEINRTIRMIADPVLDAAGLDPDTVEIFVISDPSLNAFVTGGRTMFIHSGMLRRLRTPEELAAVIAHEAGHIRGGHIVGRLEAMRGARIAQIVSTLLGVGVSAAGGGAAGAGVGAGGLGLAQRLYLRFSRAQESSADQAAVTYLTSAGLDPRAMLLVLRELEAEQGILTNVDPYLLSHPLSGARIEALRRAVEGSSAQGGRYSDEVHYWHARMRAKLDGFLSRPGSGAVFSYGDQPSAGSGEIDLYREAIETHRLPQPDRAIALIDELIALRPRDPFYWELKGQILSESGRGPAAVEPYRRALALSDSFVDGEPTLISVGLATALLTLETQEADAEALRLLERAAAAEPFDARLRRPLAIAYARAGQEGMAAVATSEALALRGRIDEAHRQAERAQRMLPTGSPGWLRAQDVLEISP